VLRQIVALQGIAELSVVGLSPLPDKVHGINLVTGASLSFAVRIFRKGLIGTLLLLRRYKAAQSIYYSAFDTDELWNHTVNPDVLVVNDINAMPIVERYLKEIDCPQTPIYLDLHEYGPEEGGRLIDRFFMNPFKRFLCERYLGRAQVVSSVSQGLVRAYKKLIGQEVHLVPNVPPYTELTAQPLKTGKIRLVHHGGFGPGRDLQGLIKAVQILGEKYELHFYLIGKERLINKLRREAEGVPVFFHEPVSTDLIARAINQYDIGVYLLRGENFNNKYAMPNKLFEFIQARLAIVTSPNHEMKQFILKNEVGRVTAECNGTSLAQTIREMKPDTILNYKRNSNLAARENCSEKYHDLIRTLTLKAAGQMHSSCVE
jgi:hypothetical protein